MAQAAALEGLQQTGELEEECRARQFNRTVLSGRLQQAVWRATDPEKGGYFTPRMLAPSLDSQSWRCWRASILTQECPTSPTWTAQHLSHMPLCQSPSPWNTQKGMWQQ
eukprot:11869746-Ditylum_brightwellii.AAC.1